MKKTVFRISPEFNAGDQYGRVESVDELLKYVKAWAEFAVLYNINGKSIGVETVEEVET